MCGIVGYIGSEKAAPFLLDGLEKLEYRGYDSAGIATLKNQKICFKKTTKRITMLKSELKNSDDFGGKIGIGHTRWATHGAPTEQNAHPHLSFGGRFAVVHNGIIENYLELKKELEADGVVFKSETDTEVVAHLLEKNFSGDTLLAISKTVAVLKGAFALLILTLESASSLYAVCKFSPLVIGVGEQCNLLASDYSALARHTTSVINMQSNEIAIITKSRVQLFSFNLQPVKREPSEINYQPDTAEKGEYEHFMMKEIKEQPAALKKTILSALKDKTVVFEGLKLTTDMIKNIKRIVIVACGSAYHAGVANKYIFEELLRLPVEVDLASEFRYRHSVLDKNVLVIAVSQSGETADTLAALIKAKKSGTHTLAVVNVVGSSISKAADDVIYTKAGSEIAVATTKAYSAQLVALYLLAIYFAKVLESANESYLLNLLSEIALLPDKIEEVFKLETCIKELAKDYHSAQSIFFVGRNINYATAMEGS
ncbi:MAG: glutamine--fructose-6-phosphate transaminase (isomerizing), partial [Clostridia bacterium]|nr:glutamine--fructose-6-phosphate transaminase (isomerizing) [Clostridia bacterium]